MPVASGRRVTSSRSARCSDVIERRLCAPAYTETKTDRACGVNLGTGIWMILLARKSSSLGSSTCALAHQVAPTHLDGMQHAKGSRTREERASRRPRCYAGRDACARVGARCVSLSLSLSLSLCVCGVRNLDAGKRKEEDANCLHCELGLRTVLPLPGFHAERNTRHWSRWRHLRYRAYYTHIAVSIAALRLGATWPVNRALRCTQLRPAHTCMQQTRRPTPKRNAHIRSQHMGA